jgi:hypothetical protein
MLCVEAQIKRNSTMLQGDDRIILGNVAKVVTVLVVIMFVLIALSNMIA